MANIIQIKSGSGKPGNGKLYPNELGYDTSNGYLYIGNASKEATGIKVAYATTAGSAENALPKTGGTMTGNIAFQAGNVIFQAIDANETGNITFQRPANYNYAAHIDLLRDSLRVYRYDKSDTYKQVASLELGEGLFYAPKISTGSITPSTPIAIANGGTGATTAAKALTNLGITATATELNYVDGVTSSIQTQINSNKTAASNAQSTANTAKTNASKAQTTADTAKTNASTAQGRADSAYNLASTANSTANAALPKAGGTITGVLKHEGNHYVHKTSNSSENSYFMKFATIKITGTYLNQEIHFKLIHRGDRITNVYVCYNNGNTTTPSLNYIQTDCINVWIHNEGGGVWGLYANAWGWDSVEVLDFTTGKYASDKITVTWLSTTTSSLPSGAISASTRPLPSRYYGDTLPSSAPAGAIFFKKV